MNRATYTKMHFEIEPFTSNVQKFHIQSCMYLLFRYDETKPVWVRVKLQYLEKVQRKMKKMKRLKERMRMRERRIKFELEAASRAASGLEKEVEKALRRIRLINCVTSHVLELDSSSEDSDSDSNDSVEEMLFESGSESDSETSGGEAEIEEIEEIEEIVIEDDEDENEDDSFGSGTESNC